MTAPVVTGIGAAHVTGTGAGFAPHRGDERIVTCIEMATGFDATLPFGNQWDDITSYVRELSTTRGRQQELQAFEAGTLNIKLSNADGRFSPWNTAGAYYPGVRVGIPIRVRISAEKSDPTGASPAIATYDPTDGGFYYAWYGFVLTITPDWSPGGEDDVWCTITAQDSFALLSRANLVAEEFPDNLTVDTTGVLSFANLEFVGDRLINVLDVSGVKLLLAGAYIFRESKGLGGIPSNSEPWAVLLLSGASFPVSEGALSHMQDASDIAFADFYPRPDNYICHRAYGEVRNTAFDGTTIFGDGAGEIPYIDVGPTYDDDNLYNDAEMTYNTGGTPVPEAIDDQASIATYGRRVFQKSYEATNLNSYGRAIDVVTRFKDPVVFVPSVTLSLRALTDAQRMRVLSLPIGYRVQVKRRPPAGGGDALTAECHFEGMQLTWQPAMKDVTAVLNLAPTRPVNSYTGGPSL